LTRTKRSKGTSQSDEPLVVNGWQIFAHPLLLTQLEKLVAAVERERGNPASANFKLLALLHRAMFRDIPEDPTRDVYRQGGTLGKDQKHWFRAKLGGRFRLFFRYSSAAKIIIFVWVNDDKTLRESGVKTDAYAVLRRCWRGAALQATGRS
jgi:toxin YhaV